MRSAYSTETTCSTELYTCRAKNLQTSTLVENKVDNVETRRVRRNVEEL